MKAMEEIKKALNEARVPFTERKDGVWVTAENADKALEATHEVSYSAPDRFNLQWERYDDGRGRFFT